MSSESLYSRSFACAFLSQVGFVLANTAVVTHYARWVAFLGGEVDNAGWITGTASIGGLLLRPWMGQWIDRFGARNIWLLGYGIFALGVLSNLALYDLGPAIYVSRTVLVVGAAIVFSSSLTYVSHLAPPERRAEAIGTLGIAGFIGIFLGPWLGDLLLSQERTRAEFSALFLVAMGLLVVPSLLLLLVKEPRRDHPSSSARRDGFLRTCRDHWPGAIMLVQTAFGLCMTVPFVFLTKYVDDTGLQEDGWSRASWFFMCYAGWGLTLRILLRRLPERWGRRKMLLSGALVMSLGMLSFLLVDAQHPNWIILPALLTGTGHSLMYHTCTSLFLHSFPSDVRGSGSALSMIAMDLGMIGGAQILGEVAHRFGYTTLFISVALCVLSAAAVYAVASVPVWQARSRARAESPLESTESR